MHRRAFLTSASALGLAGLWRASAQTTGTAAECDLVLRGGIVVDGTGGEPRIADVGVKDGLIAAIGGAIVGKQEIDCVGAVVCPGFIDLNTHLDLRCYSSGAAYGLPAPEGPFPEQLARLMVEQGVTTVLAGNAGWSAADIATHLAALRAEGLPFNYATLAGYSALREGAGEGGVAPRALAALEAGAYGISVDLAAPQNAGSPGELQALTRVAGSVEGALLSVRLRDTGSGLAGSVSEALELAAESGMRLQISRLRATLDPGWEQLAPALDLIDQAVAGGLDVAADTYAHPGCGMSVRGAFLPPEYADPATNEALAARRQDPALLAQVAERMGAIEPTVFYPRTRAWESVYDYTLVEVARAQRAINLIDFVIDLALAEKTLDRGLVAQGIYLAEMLLEHVDGLLARPWMAVASDVGGAPGLDLSQLFPWSSANTIRTLETYAEALPAGLLPAQAGGATPPPSPLGPAPIPPDAPDKPPVKPETPDKPPTEPTGPTAPPTGDEAPPEDDGPDLNARTRPLSFAEAVRRMTSLPAARLGLTDRGVLRPGARADIVVLNPKRLVDRAGPTTPLTRPAGVTHVFVNGQRCVEAGKWNETRGGTVLARGGA